MSLASRASPKTGQHEKTSGSPPPALEVGLACATSGLSRPTGFGSTALWVLAGRPRDGEWDAEVQCTAMLEGLMVEVGVE